jgi:AcrR family transcriptional regulator
MAEKTEESTRQKRESIVAAAREIFARQGYDATTIAEIASTAKVAVGTVYLYFHNKREIYSATALNWVEAISSSILDPALLALDIEEIPRAIIENSFRICRENFSFMPLFQVDIQSQEEIALHREAEQSLTSAISTFLQLAIQRGQLAPFDTTMYAKILFGLVHSVLYDCFCLQAGAHEEIYRERTIELINRLFFGPSIRDGLPESGTAQS